MADFTTKSAIFHWLCYCNLPAIYVIMAHILTAKEGVRMKRIIHVFVAICLILCGLTGCLKQATPLCRVVVEMEIFGQHQDLQFTRNYSDTQTMEDVLHCLRTMPSRIKATPTRENAERNYFVITLRLSDGDSHTYTLAAHRYFKAPNNPWVETNPAIFSKFYSVLQKA